MKVCRRCKKEKDLSSFGIASRRKDGHADYCKECKSVIDKEYRDANKDRINSSRRERYPENKTKINQRNNLSYQNNKEARKAQVQAWIEKNRHRTSHYRHNRKAKILQRTGHVPFDYYEILTTIFGNKCLKCGSGKKIEIDHVVPIANGGWHCISNMQILCKSCNAAKSNHNSNDYRPFKYYYEEV